MTSITLLEKLAERCEDAPGAPAIMDANGRGLSRRQLLEKIRVTSRGFTAAGLQPGERVLFAVRPDVAAVVLMIAIVEAGGVLVPLDSVTGPALFRSRMALLPLTWERCWGCGGRTSISPPRGSLSVRGLSRFGPSSLSHHPRTDKPES